MTDCKRDVFTSIVIMLVCFVTKCVMQNVMRTVTKAAAMSKARIDYLTLVTDIISRAAD